MPSRLTPVSHSTLLYANIFWFFICLLLFPFLQCINFTSSGIFQFFRFIIFQLFFYLRIIKLYGTRKKFLGQIFFVYHRLLGKVKVLKLSICVFVNFVHFSINISKIIVEICFARYVFHSQRKFQQLFLTCSLKSARDK